MAKRINVEIELPDGIFRVLRDQDLASKAREALIMQLLREHQISQGRAAHLMGINRHDLFSLMAKYQISFIDLTEAELAAELATARTLRRTES